ncbi:hypothetical protein BHM03_00016296 [Ensete ventricosum]|nr:hypothetical protein BHM03_00016296 [Ensete ventricosum]
MWAPERSGPPEATTSATDPCPFGVILVISFSPAIKRSLPLLGNICLTLFRPCGRRSRQKNTGGADRKPGYRRSPIVLFRHNTGLIGAPAEVDLGLNELESATSPRGLLLGCVARPVSPFAFRTVVPPLAGPLAEQSSASLAEVSGLGLTLRLEVFVFSSS